MFVVLLILHLFICIALIAVVLIQSGKGGGLAGGAFGGSAQTVFGGRGATDFITRATMILGGAFFVTSLGLALISSGVSRAPHSLFQSEAAHPVSGAPQQAPQSAPSAGGAARPSGPAPGGAPSAAPKNPAPPPGKSGP